MEINKSPSNIPVTNTTTDNSITSRSTCKACGERFSFWQRFTIASNATLTCKKCKTKYTAHMQMSSVKLGALGGGLVGVCYLIGDFYFQKPFWGLMIGILMSVFVTIYVYRYTWRKIELQPK